MTENESKDLTELKAGLAEMEAAGAAEDPFGHALVECYRATIAELEGRTYQVKQFSEWQIKQAARRADCERHYPGLLNMLSEQRKTERQST